MASLKKPQRTTPSHAKRASAGFERLWAPWRNAFIKKADHGPCFLCATASGGQDRKRFVVARDRLAFVILNRYPYNNGHLMVAPKRHVGELEKLAAAEWRSLWRLTDRAVKLLQKRLNPHGFNLGMNIGRVAGAGIPGHLHLHIVPRWSGDTNFMPIVGATKVISQSLEELYKVLTMKT